MITQISYSYHNLSNFSFPACFFGFSVLLYFFTVYEVLGAKNIGTCEQCLTEWVESLWLEQWTVAAETGKCFVLKEKKKNLCPRAWNIFFIVFCVVTQVFIFWFHKKSEKSLLFPPSKTNRSSLSLQKLLITRGTTVRMWTVQGW